MKKLSDLHYAEYEECKLDIYLPENENFETIIYFHGGGIEAGDKADLCYMEIAESVADNGFCFVSCNYRMYPKAKFPDFLEDGANAVAFIKKHIKNYGGSGELYVSGQSAGAWISMMLCLDNKYLESAGIKNDEIKGWIIDSAQQTTHFNILRERGSDTALERIDDAAPLYFVNKETRFSKMLIIFYENDIPCRYEQNMLLYKSIKHFNDKSKLYYKVLPGTHCCGSTNKDDDGKYPFVKELIKFIKTS